MDALRRAETPANNAGENVTSPVQEPSAPTGQEDDALSLEPLNGTTPHTEISEENGFEASTPVETTTDTLPETEAPIKPEAEKRSRVKLVQRSAWTQNTLMFGSGFIFILFAVGGYYAWKSGQLPAPGHLQAATLISEPPASVNKAVTIANHTAQIKPAAVPAQTVTTPDIAVTTGIAPQTRTIRSNLLPQAKSLPESSIRISKKRKGNGVNPQLSKAWQAYQHQDFIQAESLYKQVLRRYPDNRDAMLGLAAIAMYQNRDMVARYYYEHVLKTHPGDNVARVALQSLTGSGDALKDSSQLKYWLQSDPNNPQLHFALGNHQADSGNWKEAQHAYFEAFQLAPTRADYAFNLAVALDQLTLQKQALNYYRKARELAGATALFSIEQLDQRISQLEQGGVSTL